MFISDISVSIFITVVLNGPLSSFVVSKCVISNVCVCVCFFVIASLYEVDLMMMIMMVNVQVISALNVCEFIAVICCIFC